MDAGGSAKRRDDRRASPDLQLRQELRARTYDPIHHSRAPRRREYATRVWAARVTRFRFAARDHACPRSTLFRYPRGMAKARATYTCGSCGGQQPKWQGQCPDCGAWNTLTESVLVLAARRNARNTGAMPSSLRLDRVDVGPVERRRRRARANSTACSAAARPRRCRPDRRRPGHRQVDPAPPGAPRLSRRGGPRALRHGRGVGGSRSAARGPARAVRDRPLLLAETVLEPCSRTCARDPSRASWSSTRSRRCSPTSSSRRPARVSQVRECAAQLMRFAKPAHRGLPGRPRHQGGHARRARACWSTWSTRCSTSRAMSAAAFASCAPSRTGSGRQRDRFLRDGEEGFARSRTRPRFSWRGTAVRSPGA